jgi:hypothetical protein
MPDINLDVNDEMIPAPDVQVNMEPTAQVDTDVQGDIEPTAQVDTDVQGDIEPVEKFHDRIPCNWNLSVSEEDEDIIIAVNNNSREYFEGPMHKFNARMKS